MYSGNKQNEKGGREGEDWPSHLDLLAEGIHHVIGIHHNLKSCCRKAKKEIQQSLNPNAVWRRYLTESAFAPTYHNY